MTDPWVVNASPIILYARIGRLDLFEQLAPALIIPEKVIDEVQDGANKDKSAHTAVVWAKHYQSPNILVPPSVEHWDLGPGESQVISYCLQGSCWAVLDDRMARRCVTTHKLMMIGSLGVILRAKEQGLLDQARPWLYRLKDAGMYVAEDLIIDALSAMGEGE